MSVKLAVRDLAKSYGRVQAVTGVDFEIRAGEVFGLLGPNGAGKTTTIEAVIGLIEPDFGSIKVAGIDMRGNPAEAKQRIGVALQSTGLQDKITPREALRTFGSFYSRPVAADALLERFGLNEKADARVDTLSGGQRQRLALALAFVNDPEILFLDEPTVGLDPQMRRELHQRIGDFRQEGRAVLLATHDMDEAEQLCDRVGVIDRGRLVAVGAPRDLVAASRSALRVTADLTEAVDGSWAAGLSCVSGISSDGKTLRFSTTDLNGALAALVRHVQGQEIGIFSLQAGRATLEDLILELTGSGGSD